MPNSVIRTKTIFLFGAYPEYLQKKVIKEMRKRKYTVKQPKTLDGLELDGDDIIVVDVRDMDDWKEQIGRRKDANYVPIETYVSSDTSEAYFFRYYAPRKIFKLTVFGMCFYLPIMINSYRTISICQEIEKISKKILKSARRKKLTNTMETLYKYAFGDEGKEAALNTYLNMSEKRRKSKNGKELREYLEEYATEIIRWHVENAEPEEVYTVLKLNLVSADVLQAIYSELEKDMGIEVKAYFLEMIGKESSINASKEEKWTL